MFKKINLKIMKDDKSMSYQERIEGEREREGDRQGEKRETEVNNINTKCWRLLINGTCVCQIRWIFHNFVNSGWAQGASCIKICNSRKLNASPEYSDFLKIKLSFYFLTCVKHFSCIFHVYFKECLYLKKLFSDCYFQKVFVLPVKMFNLLLDNHFTP